MIALCLLALLVLFMPARQRSLGLGVILVTHSYWYWVHNRHLRPDGSQWKDAFLSANLHQNYAQFHKNIIAVSGVLAVCWALASVTSSTTGGLVAPPSGQLQVQMKDKVQHAD